MRNVEVGITSFGLRVASLGNAVLRRGAGKFTCPKNEGETRDGRSTLQRRYKKHISRAPLTSFVEEGETFYRVVPQFPRDKLARNGPHASCLFRMK